MKKLIASSLAALALLTGFSVGGSSQTPRPNLKQYLQRRMNRSIDAGMVKRAPQTGDEKMVRKAREHIDDGIFTPRSVSKKYNRATRAQDQKAAGPKR